MGDVAGSGRGRIWLHFSAEEFVQVPGGVEIRGKELRQKGPQKVVRAKNVITCGGLHADRLGQLAGGQNKPRVITFRGNYYQMKPGGEAIVKRNIYPVPSGGGIPVGVHFTPTVNESRGKQMIIGPGACITFAREGYRFTDFKLRDIFDIVTAVSFWKFAMKNMNMAFLELYRDLNKRAFLHEAQKLIPTLELDQTEPSFCGVMSQVFEDDGEPASDFIFESNCLGGHVLNVRNMPSPAATASLAIGEDVVARAAKDFGWSK
eukprot:NODE_1070_length_1017_cov_178.307851_g888_i0.p1 GENE.NODE_1070_length_1017_cov_178.307851_g888_i0~~NODE_1070_length_1017_cov_178.307851_g888_i0.p1  ORF type:complete len:269 (+),score=96.42 NODE_1070_length_1017_cov_178.307851_g888_i0:24-809(+)